MEAQQQEQHMYTPRTTMDTYGASIDNLTNPREMLAYIRLNLMNIRVNAQGEEVEVGTPLVNQYGLNSLMGTARAIISQNTTLSHLENRQEVSNLMEKISSDLITELMVSRKTFGIKSKEDASQILRIILFPAFMTFMRCYKQGERGFWKGSVSEIIHAEKGRRGGGIFNKILGR
tara:strand:- start:2191 stop:2715 length:525 start_codon:yes stop_codon:yes gene_type:complete